MQNKQNNQALALKYRPITFSQLVGQDAVAKTLSRALDTARLGHAYLFSGLRGSGKTSSARMFARGLECDKGPTSNPCGECANCQASNPHKMNHLDIIELDGASTRGIEDIRSLIEQTKYHPNLGRFKIFIIDEVHMLTKEAFNALLKTLEEPPSYVKFILATTDPLKLPPTILSRTQHFRFKRISEKQILEHLKNILQIEQISYEEKALLALIRSGNGSLRDTLTLLDQAIIFGNGAVLETQVTSMLGLINPQHMQTLFDAVLSGNRERLLKEMEGFFDYECEMLLGEFGLYLKDRLLENTHNSTLTPILIERFLRTIAESKKLLFMGANDQFVLSITLLKMQECLQICEIDKVIAQLEGNLPIADTPQSKPSTQPNPNQTPTTKESTAPINNTAQQYQQLIDKISYRSYDLGEIFQQRIEFIDFKDNTLFLVSHAQDAQERKRLNDNFALIKTLTKDIFGIDCTINIQKATHKTNQDPTPIPQPQTINENNTQPPTPPPSDEAPKNDQQGAVETLLKRPNIELLKEKFAVKKIHVKDLV